MSPYELPVADESLIATQRNRLQRGRLYDLTSDCARMSQGTRSLYPYLHYVADDPATEI